MSFLRDSKLLFQVFVFSASMIFAGCASSDLHLVPDYKPVSEVSVSGGKLVLSSVLEGTVSGSTGRIQWILGEVKDSDGRVQGNITSPIAPNAIVRDALQQELLRSGYSVKIDKTGHKEAAQALVLTASRLHLDEISSLIKVEADCRVSFSVEVWKKGLKTNTLSFESRFSDFAVKDREKLHKEVLQKAFASAFKKAVPGIIEQLKK